MAARMETTMTLDPDNEGSLPLLAVTVNQATQMANVTRSRLFQAIKDCELCGRKAGKQLVIEVRELERWLKTLPYRGRTPIAAGSDSDAPERAKLGRRGGRKVQARPAPTIVALT